MNAPYASITTTLLGSTAAGVPDPAATVAMTVLDFLYDNVTVAITGLTPFTAGDTMVMAVTCLGNGNVQFTPGKIPNGTTSVTWCTGYNPVNMPYYTYNFVPGVGPVYWVPGASFATSGSRVTLATSLTNTLAQQVTLTNNYGLSPWATNVNPYTATPPPTSGNLYVWTGLAVREQEGMFLAYVVR